MTDKRGFSPWWALILAMTLFVMLFASVFQNCTAHVSPFVYPMDDSYINLAMAKNLASYGNWGTNATHFASASSSPLWTLLTALVFRFVGPSDFVPLWMNFGTALLLIGLAFFVLRRERAPTLLTVICLVMLVVATPLVPLVYGGLEHTLHAFLCLLFVWIVSRCLSRSPSPCGRGMILGLGLVAFLLPVVRYESLFLVFNASILLFVRRQWIPLALVITGSALSTSLAGIFFWMNGGLFLPNSVLLKGQSWVLQVSSIEDLRLPLTVLLFKSSLIPHLYPLMSVTLILFALGLKKHSYWSEGSIWLQLALFTCMLHLLFARVGWFYRYEAYLIVMAIVGIGVSITALYQELFADLKAIAPQLAMIAASIYCAFPLLYRGWTALHETPIASQNIHDQQVQMAQFVRQHYNNVHLALNDIGAINYRTGAIALDLMGLGSNEVMYLRRSARFDTEAIRHLARKEDVRIALVYESWFQGNQALPTEWIKVGSWTLRNNLICGDKTVSFFATCEEEVRPLRHALESYATSLPETVLMQCMHGNMPNHRLLPEREREGISARTEPAANRLDMP